MDTESVKSEREREVESNGHDESAAEVIEEYDGIPIGTIARWVRLMQKMDARARRGEWASFRLFEEDELGDMLHMFYRSGLQLLDVERSESGILCELSWRHAKRGYAKRMRAAARRFHFGLLAGPNGAPEMPE